MRKKESQCKTYSSMLPCANMHTCTHTHTTHTHTHVFKHASHASGSHVNSRSPCIQHAHNAHTRIQTCKSCKRQSCQLEVTMHPTKIHTMPGPCHAIHNYTISNQHTCTAPDHSHRKHILLKLFTCVTSFECTLLVSQLTQTRCHV